MKRLIVTLFVMLLVVSSGYAGDQHWQAEDTSPAIWIHNTGTEKATITIYEDDGATNRVVIGSTVTVMDMSGTAIDTAAELASAVASATNSAGKKPLKAIVATSSDSETVDAELLVNTSGVAIEGGDWGSIPLDTSDVKYFSIFLPASKNGPASRGTVDIKKIYGDIGGTGNITVEIYVDQVQKYQSSIVSPAYVPSFSDTNSVSVGHAADEVGPGILDIDLDFTVGRSENCLIKATRATTGTTGGIGIRTVDSK